MQRHRAGITAATAITASAVLLASCNAIFGITSGTAVEPDAAVADASVDSPAPDDSPLPDGTTDSSVDSMIDGPTVDAMIDGPPVDGSLVDALPDAPPIDAPPIDAPPIDAPPIDAPPIDGPTCITHPSTANEDGVQGNDQTDLCPHLPEKTDDTDGDQVGGLCDPWPSSNPTAQSFVGFSPEGRPCGWTENGTWTYVAGTATPAIGTSSLPSLVRDLELKASDNHRVVAGFNAPTLSASSPWFGVTMDGASSPVSCWFLDTSASTTGAKDTIELRIGATTIPFLVEDIANPRLELTSQPNGEVACNVFRGTGAASEGFIEGITTAMPRKPGVQLAALSAGVRYIVVYSGTPP